MQEHVAKTGLPLVGAFAFGDSPELADELLAFIQRGTKRATAGSVADAESEPEPIPEPGMCWGVLDGRGELVLAIETTHVEIGRMGDVTPSFAWDEGEYDRSRETWLDGHRRFFRRQGVADPDSLEVLFERFRVVWPIPDEVRWLAPGVRALQHGERDWFRRAFRDRHGTTTVARRGRDHDVDTLPGLVLEVDGARVGATTFRNWPDGTVDCVSMDAFVDGHDADGPLTEGLTALGRAEGWRELWLPAGRPIRF